MARDTRERVIDAFFELAEKYPDRTNFSMTEIAKQAGVSRQAIYQKHFKNVDEIIEFVHGIIDAQIRETYYNYGNDTTVNPYVYVSENILPLIYQGRKWIRCLYMTDIDPTWRSFIISTYTKWGMNQLTPNGDAYGFSDAAMINLVVNMTMTIIEAWIIQEEPMPPEQFKKHFLAIVNTPLNDYLLVENTKKTE